MSVGEKVETSSSGSLNPSPDSSVQSRLGPQQLGERLHLVGHRRHRPVTANANTIEVANTSLDGSGTDDGKSCAQTQNAQKKAICNSVDAGGVQPCSGRDADHPFSVVDRGRRARHVRSVPVGRRRPREPFPSSSR